VIRPTQALRDFEAQQLRRPADHAQALRLFEMLWEEARQLQVIPARCGLDGLDHDIDYARAINGLPAPRGPRPAPR